MKTVHRCAWSGHDPLMIRYHDREWGVPVQRDRKMFEFLILETFQAGLSWRTVLHKRLNFRRAFANFDYHRVAKFTDRDIQRLLKDAGIIRNRQKITAAVRNAQALIRVRQEYGTFGGYLWSFVNNVPLQPKRRTMNDLPAITFLSEKISNDLKKRGFSFLGPTVVYAHVQATGLINDHTRDCFRWTELNKKLSRRYGIIQP